MKFEKPIRWSAEKNLLLQNERQVSFEEVLSALENGGLLEVLEHLNMQKYPNQKMLVVRMRAYIYLVPFIETDQELFLKTIIPSRKATKQYE